MRILNFVRRFSLPIIIAVALALILLAYNFGQRAVYQAHPEFSTQEKAGLVLRNVGELIQLPEGENPTMATINDAASAKLAQPFLKDAQNGDILIIYSNAQSAILYRPSTNKLIAVGPVNTGSTQSAQIQKQPVVETAATTTNDKKK